jgi:hypothetical protein
VQGHVAATRHGQARAEPDGDEAGRGSRVRATGTALGPSSLRRGQPRRGRATARGGEAGTRRGGGPRRGGGGHGAGDGEAHRGGRGGADERRRGARTAISSGESDGEEREGVGRRGREKGHEQGRPR